MVAAKQFEHLTVSLKKIIIDFSDYIQGNIEFNFDEKKYHIEVINKGIDDTNIEIILKTIGIKIKGPNKVKDSLMIGEKKVYKFHAEFEKDYINKPVLIRAEVFSNYSKCILETGSNNYK